MIGGTKRKTEDGSAAAGVKRSKPGSTAFPDLAAAVDRAEAGDEEDEEGLDGSGMEEGDDEERPPVKGAKSKSAPSAARTSEDMPDLPVPGAAGKGKAAGAKSKGSNKGAQRLSFDAAAGAPTPARAAGGRKSSVTPHPSKASSAAGSAKAESADSDNDDLEEKAMDSVKARLSFDDADSGDDGELPKVRSVPGGKKGASAGGAGAPPRGGRGGRGGSRGGGRGGSGRGRGGRGGRK